jgi:hypothetical protein
LTGVLLSQAELVFTKIRVKQIAVAISIVFFSYYIYQFFSVYPQQSLAWFQTESSPLAGAYERMLSGHSCTELRE